MTSQIDIYTLHQPDWIHRIDALEALLNQEETARAERFRFPRDRHSFIICRGWLRLLAADRLNSSASDISFEYGYKGKPSISGLSFNLSHSKDWVAFAFAENGQLGLDMEPYRNYPQAIDIASRFFSAEEASMLEGLDDDSERDRRFFDLWTRKEALIKATGKGLSLPLNRFFVGLDESFVDDGCGNYWQLQSLSLVDGYAMALCFSENSGWRKLAVPELL